jgi:hypothetical protein
MDETWRIDKTPWTAERLKGLGLKPMALRRTFEHDGEDFSAFYAAMRWVHSLGFDTWTLSGDDPIGIVRTVGGLAGKSVSGRKWRNLDEDEIAALDGVLVSDDWRNGDVGVWFAAGLDYDDGILSWAKPR